MRRRSRHYAKHYHHLAHTSLVATARSRHCAWSAPTLILHATCSLVLSQRSLAKSKREVLSLRNSYQHTQGDLHEKVYREIDPGTTPGLTPVDLNGRRGSP